VVVPEPVQEEMPVVVENKHDFLMPLLIGLPVLIAGLVAFLRYRKII
jgi:hypothetical protein